MSQPKILLLDLETSYNLTEEFQLRNVDIRPEQILEPSYVLCFAAKWRGARKTEFRSVFHDGRDAMVKRLWELMNEADVIVDYYGRGIDIPRSNQEFLLANLPPPAPFIEVDLWRTVKRFGFPSSKLGYVLERLGLTGKVHHTGHQLWHDCMRGDPKAWALMKRYNVRDVTALEALLDRLGSWVVGWPNMAAYDDSGLPRCTHCQSDNLVKNGTRVKATGRYQRWLCVDCKGHMTSTTRLNSAKLVTEV